jgi:hypothetical protein
MIGVACVSSSWLIASSMPELTLASLATFVTRLWESKKFVLSSVIKAPAMMAMNAVMISTPLRTLPRCERILSFVCATNDFTGS